MRLSGLRWWGLEPAYGSIREALSKETERNDRSSLQSMAPVLDPTGASLLTRSGFGLAMSLDTPICIVQPAVEGALLHDEGMRVR
jgi:hypothetical protein